MSSYPDFRPRRLRRTAAMRRAFAETSLLPSDLVAPLFVKEGIDEPVPVASMPGQSQHTLESLLKESREIVERGVAGLLVFGIPAFKDEGGSESFNPDGIVQGALRALKDEFGDDVLLIADLCLCEYTSHGHCGVLSGQTIDNDATLDVYRRIAVSQAEAGADIIAPSGMMDGQVGAIRSALDAGHSERAILAYAAKYASSFYGPFRDAGEGAPQFGDRRSYQEDPPNVDEALREVALDIAEGADAVMVKPAIGYLDVLRAVKERFRYPTAAYNVSGEYSMLMAAAERGWIDERAATLETLTAIRRAGADLVITYHAKKAAEWLT
ncbi:MAG TPA: porphobilinogen synthase [Actinomycetota bacterium]|jgi:porphobilinogen synthase|nr:porphobilinogen synthase [Actinomycetota bacterium]